MRYKLSRSDLQLYWAVGAGAAALALSHIRMTMRVGLRPHTTLQVSASGR